MGKTTFLSSIRLYAIPWNFRYRISNFQPQLSSQGLSAPRNMFFKILSDPGTPRTGGKLLLVAFLWPCRILYHMLKLDPDFSVITNSCLFSSQLYLLELKIYFHIKTPSVPESRGCTQEFGACVYASSNKGEAGWALWPIQDITPP